MNFTYNLTADQITNIKHRKVVLFDISVWNNLADKKTAEATEVCELLLAKKRDGILFCPLTAPTIWELRKQAGESFLRTANLMEQLSLNIAFRGIDQIIDIEIENFLKYIIDGEFKPLAHYQLFGPFLSYLTPSYSLEFQNNVLTQEQHEICRLIDNEIQSLSFTKFMTMIGENSSPKITKPQNYQSANIERRKLAKSSKKTLMRIEIESIAKSIIIPKLNKKRSELPLETQLLVADKISKLPKSKKYGSAIEYMLSFLPIISSYIHILTISGYDINRRNSENDFYDIEILIYGLSYASVFSAADKWIKHLMKLALREGNIGALCYAGSFQELKQKLKLI